MEKCWVETLWDLRPPSEVSPCSPPSAIWCWVWEEGLVVVAVTYCRGQMMTAFVFWMTQMLPPKHKANASSCPVLDVSCHGGGMFFKLHSTNLNSIEVLALDSKAKNSHSETQLNFFFYPHSFPFLFILTKIWPAFWVWDNGEVASPTLHAE